MKEIKLFIKTKSKNYPLIIGSKIINKLKNILRLNKISFEKCLIIYDTKVPKKKLNILKKQISTKKKLFITLMQPKKIKI